MSSTRWPWLAALILAAAVAGARAQDQPSLNALTGETELARLVDLSVEKLQLNLQYDPQLIRGDKVTLRFRRPVTDEELWALTRTLLEANGLAVVDTIGGEFMSIVKVQDAQGVAGLTEQGAPGAAGYLRVLTEAEHRTAKEIVDALRPLMSKPGGVIAQVGNTDLLLVADFRERVDEVMKLLRQLDVPIEDAAIETITISSIAPNVLSSLINSAVQTYAAVTGEPLKGKTLPLPQGDGVLLIAPPAEVPRWRALVGRLDRQAADAVVETIPVTHLGATQLTGLIDSASAAYAAVTGQELKGKLIPSADDSAVVLVAPPAEADHWKTLLERFDERQAVRTESYVPRHFGVDEVAQLVEDTVRDLGPRGSGDQWRLVSDDLTGTLIVTATGGEHEKIAALLERLDAVPSAAQRPLRSFPIRNRSVHEVLDILARLIEGGVLDPGADEPGPGPRQQTRRDVLPPESPRDLARPALPVERERPGTAGGRREPAQPARLVAGGEGFPLTLTADEGTNTLIAVGDPHRLDQIETLIQTLDVRQPQVQLEVLLVALTDGQTLDLGAELQKVEVSGDVMFDLASFFGLGTPGVGETGDDVTGRGGTALILDPGNFRVLVRALETINQGRALNVPRVLVNNNQQALLDSVLQQPFTSTNASNTVATTSFGGTQDAGTSVTVTPQIAEGDHLVLTYSVALSQFVGESADSSIPPPRQQNTLESVATIPDGYTIALGGLETISEAEAESRVPLLSAIPFLGELFKNRSSSTNRARFYVFIRADIMRHGTFEELRYLSDREVARADIDDGWPEVEPRVIR